MRTTRLWIQSATVFSGLLFACPDVVVAAPIRVALISGFSAGSAEASGMDTLNTRLQDHFSGNTGFSSLVFPHDQADSAAIFLNAIQPPSNLVVVGHSLGGAAAVTATALSAPRVIDLLIQIDSVGVLDEVRPANAERGINYYQISEGLFEPQGATFVFGSENINVEVLFGDPSITHTSIDDHEGLHALIIQAIEDSIDPLLWFEPSVGVALGGAGSQFSLEDDDHAGPIALGFDFPFFGASYNQIFFNSNGTLTFGAGRDSWDNYPFPMAGLDQFGDIIVPTIAPFFDDHDNRFGGILSFLNTVPGVFAATWSGVPLYTGDAGGPTNSFQSILFGPDNPFGYDPGSIVFNYGGLSGTGGTADGSPGFESSENTATIGLNNGDGINFVVPFELGIGSPGGLITPADFPLLMNQEIDPLFFVPVGTGYAVEAVPFSQLPSLSGFTTNAAAAPVPEPSSLAISGVCSLFLLGYRATRKRGGIRATAKSRSS